MMNTNPILRNYRSRMLYASIWTVIVIVQTLNAYFINGLPFEYLLIDSLIFAFLFACCLIPLWYPVRFNDRKHKTRYSGIPVHLILSSVVIFICLMIDYRVMQSMVSDNADFLLYLKTSLGWKAIEGLFFYAVTVLTYYLYLYVERLNEKAANEIRLNQLVKDGELNLLRSQINPHFLFNGLNSINSLIIVNPEQAQKMLVALSDYLRYSVLSVNHTYSCVADETENIARYLSVEKLRFGDKLIYESEIDPDCLPVRIPAMLLQPLLENAVKHGVYESLQTVRIMLKITKDAQYLNIELNNDFDKESISPKKGSGTGLKNIRERLHLLYGNSATLYTKADDGKFIALLKIPLSFDD